MTDTGTALLRAVLEEPADDLRRRAYADWLDEQGQEERAEYIRLSLRLYHYRSLEEEGVTWDELFCRQEELLARHPGREQLTTSLSAASRHHSSLERANAPPVPSVAA